MIESESIIIKKHKIYCSVLQKNFPVSKLMYPFLVFQISTFVPWIKCIKENAEKGLSDIKVKRACFRLIRRFNPEPFTFS